MNKSVFGVIGLGVMGKSLSLNIAEKGHKLSVYNRSGFGEEQIVNNFLEAHDSFKNISGFTDLSKFMESLAKPRKILLMIKAGSAIDHVVDALYPLLSEGDIIIDGGNSHYQDTKRRCELLESKNMSFIGCGISGGEEGARYGPSIMPGCTKETYKNISSILESIAAKDSEQNPCCTYIGPDGAGHFIKMVHNGIEYVEMQLLAELYAIMAKFMNYEEIADIFSEWNKGELSSYLLDITSKIFRKKEGDHYLLDRILDKAGNKGTGSWSSIASFNLGMANTMMTSAVFARYISSFKDERKKLCSQANLESTKNKIDLVQLKKAYQFARIVNHHQGFELMKHASKDYGWNLNLSEIARIWTGGCIIKSELMSELVTVFRKVESLLDHNTTIDALKINETSISKVLNYGISNRINLDSFYSAFNYWIAMTTEKLPANLIQAQRDYFGAHTYQRIDASEYEFFHTNWIST